MWSLSQSDFFFDRVQRGEPRSGAAAPWKVALTV
jgi:hypothetical protein